MAQNLFFGREYQNSSKKTQRSTSVFYLDSSTSSTDKDLLIETHTTLNDDVINELKNKNNSKDNNSSSNSTSSQSYSIESVILRKPFNEMSDETSYSSATSSSYQDVNSRESSVDTKSSNSSFMYNYSVNSTIASDLDHNPPDIVPPKVPERKRNSGKLKKIKDGNKIEANKDENDSNNNNNSNYWSNEIQVGVTKTNYVQKVRLKFEMFSAERPTAIATSLSAPQTKVCKKVITYPVDTEVTVTQKNKSFKTSNSIFFINNSRRKSNNHCDDKIKLLPDDDNNLRSEDEVDEISDCEEAAEKVELKQIIEKQLQDHIKKKNKKKYKKSKSVESKNDDADDVQNDADLPEIIVNDFGELHLGTDDVNDECDNDKKRNSKSNLDNDDNNKEDNKAKIKRRRGIMRSNNRRKTDIVEAKNPKYLASKSKSYHSDEKYLSDRELNRNSDSEEPASKNKEAPKSPIDEFTYGGEGILPMVEELIKTEEKYVESLKEGIQNYGGIFTREDLPEGLKGKRFALLGNVDEILEFHETFFLPMLKTNSNEFVKMFDAFRNLIEENEFYPYVMFVINKRNSMKLLEKHQSYFKKLQIELGDKLGINSFLIKPIQRLQRYPLPLQEFFKTKFLKPEFKAEVASCCKLEKRLRDFITVVNESEAVNDIEDCFDLNVYHQGRFLKADEFKIYDYSIRKYYPAKSFFFEKCIIYTEIKDRRLLYRGHYPMHKIGFLPSSKLTKFTLYFEKRKKQECDFEAEPNIIDLWTKLLQPILEAEINDEIKKNEERHLLRTQKSSIGSTTSSLLRQFNSNDFNSAYRVSADSGFENMSPYQSIRSPAEIEEEKRTSTWYDTM